MDKLQQIYGGNLVVTSLDAQGATFHVRGLTSEVLMRDLMAKKADVFGDEVPAGGGCVLGPGDFQILAGLATADAAAISLRYLPAMPDPSAYRSGFWYY
jgi:hypothetical protein